MNKFLLLISFFFVGKITAQEKMQVIRCTAPELQDPIQNVFVDKDNNKWVGNSNGLYQVHAIDFASEVTLGAGEQSLLKLPNGNSDLKWSEAEMEQILGGEAVSAAFYDSKLRELWVGTERSGIFRLKVKSGLELVGQINSKNSKLKSNHINCISKDRDDRFWIGTDEGVLVGNVGKWKLVEKLFNIEAIEINRGHIWATGDDFVWQIENGEDWYPIDIEEGRYVEGSIRDIAVDSKGRVWIASEVVVRYNPEADHFTYFGPAQYFTSQDVNYISVDKDDALWVGTQDKGLFLIEKASAITVTCLVDKGLSCDFSKNDASLKVRVTGGQPPYEYDWNRNIKGENPTGLGAGEYEVTVTDKNGKSNTGKITIEDPRFTVNIVQEKEESGKGAADASARITVDGGMAPFKYQWDNGETTQTASKLTEGAHSVTVTDDNGCTFNGSILITQQLAALSISLEQNIEIACAGDKKADLKVIATGGKAPYMYSWNRQGLVGEKLVNLAAGNYEVTVTDALGTQMSEQFSISEPKPLKAEIQIQTPASTGNSDGKAMVEVEGGTPEYTYRWKSNETTKTATKLAPGLCSVTVTDANGCTFSNSINVPENILPLQVSISQTAEINCPGEATAALNVQANGGKEPYNFQWSNSNASGDAPSGLSGGDYVVSVTDVEGTVKTAKITISEPAPLELSITAQQAALTGTNSGKAKARISGGTGDYTYKWDNGETERNAAQLSAGTHTLTVTDAAGCQVTAKVDISENILSLSADIEQTAEINCNGGNSAALEVSVNGGKPPFTYAWSDSGISGELAQSLTAGIYQVTVTDVTGTTTASKITISEPKALAVNIRVEAPASTGNSDGRASANASGGTENYTYKWDNGESQKTASKLSPGTHTVTILDAQGCQTTGTIDISENILPLSASIDQTAKINCNEGNGGGLKVEVKGGKGPFNYSWSSDGIAGDRANNLAAGNYQVTITDVTGTTTSATINISEPEALSVSIRVDAPATTDNADGKATALANGGTQNYTFKWDNGESDKTASKLAPGARSVTVTDANGCSKNASVEILENILPLQVSLSESSDIKCFGAADAALNVEVSGGKSPFTYKWNQSGVTGENPKGLQAGAYEVTVSDVTGATKASQISIGQPEALEVKIKNVTSASELDSEDGEARLIVRGGLGNYSYRWDNGETDSEAKRLKVGNHTVTVTDANGCEATATFEIKKKLIPELTAGNLRLGQSIRLRELVFDADSTVLKAASLPTLDEIYYFMEQNPEIVVEIGGHTNGVPTHEYCDELSTERAKNIADYIMNLGIPSERITYKGYGKRKPIASNKTPDGRRRNQRVELKVLKLRAGD